VNLLRPHGAPRLLVVAALGLHAAAALAETDAEAVVRLRGEITRAIGDPVCGNVAFCRVMPIGADACGNPTGWVVFNNAPDLRALIETRVSEVTFLEEELMRGTPRPSQCERARQPRLACVNHRCVLGDTSY